MEQQPKDSSEESPESNNNDAKWFPEGDISADKKAEETPIEGWRKYVGFGTITMSLLVMYSISQKAVIATIVYILGALILMPYIARATLKDGTKAGCGMRFTVWLVFFMIGLIVMPPSQSPETPASEGNKETTSTPAPVKTEKPAPTPKPTSTPTPTPKPTQARSKEQLLQGFQENINEAKLAEFVESYSIDKQDPDKINVVVTNAVYSVEKEIRQQFAQKLWQMWADVCYFNVKDIDSCRIQIKDIMGNTIAQSSVLGGSLVKLKK